MLPCFTAIFAHTCHELPQEPQSIPGLADILHRSIPNTGQTGSGKTYTMGSGSQSDGIIAGVVADLFSRMASIPEREFIVRAKFVELYNVSPC